MHSHRKTHPRPRDLGPELLIQKAETKRHRPFFFWFISRRTLGDKRPAYFHPRVLAASFKFDKLRAMDSANPYAPPTATATPPALPKDDISKQLDGIQYPLTLSFKILALSSQVTVTDANGRVVIYTKQKLFKFREHIQIFTDKTQSTLLAEIRANKVIDWSARYFSTDAQGGEIGSVGRRGWRSLWKAHYETFNPGDNVPDFSIHEENPWAKVADSFLGEIPLIGLLSGYLFHPKYLATRNNGTPTMRMTKQPAFFEGRFLLEKLGDATPREQLNLFLSFLMLITLERRRG